MSNEETRAVVLRYIDAVWNRGDMAAFAELTTPEFRYHLGGQPALDREGMRGFLTMVRVAFPDWRVEPAEVVAEADLVAVRWSGEVIHQGPFHGIPPTDRKIFVGGINLYKVAGGRVTTEWEQMDTLGMLRDLGVLPA